MSGRQKKQWIFITDGCNCSSTSQYQEQHDCLLAVSFSSPMADKDLFSHHHEGTVVCDNVEQSLGNKFLMKSIFEYQF